MNARIYTVLSVIIPGFILDLVIAHIWADLYPVPLVPVHMLSIMVFGYLLSIIATWLEAVYFITWCGRPSKRLLNGRDVWRVRFYHSSIAKAQLQLDFNGYASEEDLFHFALRYVQGKSRKVKEFKALYEFSRNLLTALLLSTLLLASHYYSNWRFYVLLMPCLLVVWLHCKQVAYFHAREVLRVYIKSRIG